MLKEMGLQAKFGDVGEEKHYLGVYFDKIGGLT